MIHALCILQVGSLQWYFWGQSETSAPNSAHQCLCFLLKHATFESSHITETIFLMNLDWETCKHCTEEEGLGKYTFKSTPNQINRLLKPKMNR